MIKRLLFLFIFIISNYSFANSSEQCSFQPGSPCLCTKTVITVDDSDGPYHGRRYYSYPVYQCPDDIQQKLSDEYFRLLQAGNINPDDYRIDHNIPRIGPKNPMLDFLEHQLAQTVHDLFKKYQNRTTQDLIDRIRNWAPVDEQLIQDIQKFRQERLNNLGKLSANDQAMFDYLNELAELLKNPDAQNSIPLKDRPTKIPQTVDKKQAQDYFSNLHKLSQSGDYKNLAEEINKKLRQGSSLSSDEDQFYKTELLRTYLNKDYTFKSLPLVKNPGIKFNNSANSSIGKRLRGIVNQIMAMQAQVMSAIGQHCQTTGCTSAEDKLLFNHVNNRFNQMYTDLMRIDRASTGLDDSGEYVDQALAGLNNNLNSTFNNYDDIRNFIYNEYSDNRSNYDPAIYGTTRDQVDSGLTIDDPEMKVAKDVSNLLECSVQIQDCIQSGNLNNFLGLDVGSDVGPLNDLSRQRIEAKKLLDSSSKLSNSTLEDDSPELYKFSKVSISVSSEFIGTNDKNSAEVNNLTTMFIDAALSFTPGVSLAKDAYEAVLGKGLVSGEELETFDRSMAVIGVVTFGASTQIATFGKYAAKAIPKLELLGQTVFRMSDTVLELANDVTNSARKLGLKAKYEISNFAQLSKQVLRADTNTFKYIEKIAESASKVSPKLGDKYVRQLPDLTGSFKEAFEGTIHKGTYKPGEVFFQALRTGQDKPGRWFSPIKPIDSNHADELLNISKWGNDAGQLRVFKVKESVSGYAGKVEGGSGHQFFIPNDVPLSDVIEEIILD